RGASRGGQVKTRCGLRAAGRGAAGDPRQIDGFLPQLDVARLARSGEALQADPYVAAALERQLGDARADHVAADDRNGPRQLRTVEHFEVGVERRAGRRQAEAYARAAAAQIIR